MATPGWRQTQKIWRKFRLSWLPMTTVESDNQVYFVILKQQQTPEICRRI